MKTIAVITSLDTKGKETLYIKDAIERFGSKALIIDVGVKEPPYFTPDIARHEVAAAAGIDWDTVKDKEKRVRISTMTSGLEVLIPKLYAEGKLSAVFSMGGLQNTTMGTSAMKTLPLGVPKLMLSTMASSNRPFGPFVGTKDMTLMHSVGDILGVNPVTKAVMDNAVGAIVGMAEHAGNRVQKTDRILVGATMLGVTNDGVSRAVSYLEEAGYDVVTFHANGAGGPAMEELIGQDTIDAAMDLTLHEIDAEFFGGHCSGATNRLLMAAEKGIPQVVSLGASDVIDYEVVDLDKVREYGRRKFVYQHPTIQHIKLIEEEAHKVGTVIGERLSKAKGPLTLVIPRGGFHQSSYKGGPIWDPAIDEIIIGHILSRIAPSTRVVETAAHINEPAFSRVAADEMIKLLKAMR